MKSQGCLAEFAHIVYMTWVSSRIFCLEGKFVCEDRLCTKHAKFLTSHSYATVLIAHVRTVL